MPGDAVLTPAQRELIAQTRRAVLATTADDGRPRLVPIAFATAEGRGRAPIVYSPLDDKPKRVSDPRRLARVRDVRARPRVSVLIDRWSEDWSELAWLRMDGTALLLEPHEGNEAEHHRAVKLLRERYSQYLTHDLDNLPLLRIEIDHLVYWDARS